MCRLPTYDAAPNVCCRHNTAKNMTTANASLIKGSWELKPGYNFTKQDAIVALSKKQRADKFTVTVQPNTKDAMLEWQHKPLTVGAAYIWSQWCYGGVCQSCCLREGPTQGSPTRKTPWSVGTKLSWGR